MPLPPSKPKPFLGVNFADCRVYGRLYRNKEQTAYIGRCPSCGRPIKIPIGEEGINNRFFIAYCRSK